MDQRLNSQAKKQFRAPENVDADYFINFFSLPAWQACRIGTCVSFIASKDAVWTHSPEP